jgi:hypothetical protein
VPAYHPAERRIRPTTRREEGGAPRCRSCRSMSTRTTTTFWKRRGSRPSVRHSALADGLRVSVRPFPGHDDCADRLAIVAADDLTLLEAGEKAVNPPLVIQDGVVMRDDVQIYAGGTTYIDREYDEQLGEAIRVLDTGAKGGLAFGEKIIERYEALIKEAFYLNKINLPEPGKDMTAYETRKRVEEYVRSALPLFEPMEMEYNGALCDKTFGVLMRHGAFGPIDNMPQELGGQNIEFKFASLRFRRRPSATRWLRSRRQASWLQLLPRSIRLFRRSRPIGARLTAMRCLGRTSRPSGSWTTSRRWKHALQAATTATAAGEKAAAAVHAGAGLRSRLAMRRSHCRRLAWFRRLARRRRLKGRSCCLTKLIPISDPQQPAEVQQEHYLRAQGSTGRVTPTKSSSSAPWAGSSSRPARPTIANSATTDQSNRICGRQALCGASDCEAAQPDGQRDRYTQGLRKIFVGARRIC